MARKRAYGAKQRGPLANNARTANCPWSTGIDLLDLPEDLPLYVDHDFEAVQAHFDDRRILLPSSSLLLFEDGEWVDFQPGLGAPHQSKIDYLLLRNNYLEEGPTEPMVGVDSFPEDADMPIVLTLNNYWTALNMSGVDLQGIRIISGAISGSDFSGADLHPYAHRPHRFLGSQLQRRYLRQRQTPRGRMRGRRGSKRSGGRVFGRW